MYLPDYLGVGLDVDRDNYDKFMVRVNSHPLLFTV